MRLPTLFTIGYETATPADLVARLRAEGIERVVDVRELPLSRRQGFSKTLLAETLAAAGILYEHVRELGNPKPNRDRYKRGDVKGGARSYRAHLHNGAFPAVVDLAQSIETSKTCLLCVEDTHETCHRAVIAGAVAELLPRVAVVHL
jgi:uncharacterized protein (DUF488 family)